MYVANIVLTTDLITDKIAPIQEVPTSQNVKQLRSFLGLV